MYHTFFADWRFAISGQQINRRQSINGNLESIGYKSGLETCRILSLFCNKTFRVSHHRMVYLTEPSRDNLKNTNDVVFINYWKPSLNFIIAINNLYIHTNMYKELNREGIFLPCFYGDVITNGKTSNPTDLSLYSHVKHSAMTIM